RFRFHHHPRAAAERAIIHLPVAIKRVVAQVVQIDLNQTGLDRAANDSKFKDPAEYLRENRDDVEPHCSILDFGFWILDYRKWIDGEMNNVRSVNPKSKIAARVAHHAP